jgi:hypothetical protein
VVCSQFTEKVNCNSQFTRNKKGLSRFTKITFPPLNVQFREFDCVGVLTRFRAIVCVLRVGTYMVGGYRRLPFWTMQKKGARFVKNLVCIVYLSLSFEYIKKGK